MKIIFGILIILCHQVIYSQDQMFQICPLKVGEQIPIVRITDNNNQEILLPELLSKKPTVLIFYRGAWCGYCTKHLSELNAVREVIDSLGYHMLGITVDQSSKLKESYERSESEIQVYSDSKLEATKAFGLDWQLDEQLFRKYKENYKLDLEEWSGQNHHSLAVPAIFIIREGIIQFQYVNPNYRKRLKPETLIAILKTI